MSTEQMDLIIQTLRQNLSLSGHKLMFFDSELNRIQNTIKSLVLKGECSSLLVIGRRGVGKKHLIKEAIGRCRMDKEICDGFSEVHLNGIIHVDDRSAMKSLAKQLHRESLFDSLDNENCIENCDDEPKLLPFSQQLHLFLEQIQHCDKNKAVLIVLHEFDLFALHRNQLLLYNLFDCCQCSKTPICVIGLTCRLDVMELLEKRVKSRFSHRQIYLTSPGAPIENGNSYATQDEVDVVTKSQPFERFCQICQHLLTVDSAKATANVPRSKCSMIDAQIKAWNDHVAELMLEDIVVDSLRQAWSISVSIKRLINLLIPIVASLSSSGKTRIDPVQFIDSLCSLRLDTKVNALKGLSILELFLVTSMVKLQELNEDQAINFEILYTEYVKFCRSNCPNYLYDKTVVLKALDTLVDCELIISGRLALTASSHPIGQSKPHKVTGASTNSSLPNYRPLYCHVDALVLNMCLDAYPNCPVELKHWIHSKTF